ncbi:MAG: peptidoglycan-associated lipoprotein Pal [Desulfuromonadaceae bacterium]|nr:peptidoglycan-associated lipoprotein Pal [Desulfuromonadaceae bacterium]
MNTGQRIIMTVGSFGLMLGAFGCASKDVVKKDEPIAVSKPVDATPQKNDATPSAPVVPSTTPSARAQQSVKAAATDAVFDKIYFDFDNSDLSKSSRDTLTQSAEILMKDKKTVKVRIEGNCDERGSAEYNLALGERRAKAAAKYLITLGVQPERLSVLSYGKEKPAAQGNDEAAWSKNRRDEFVIQK